jgi:hypothetical protein
MFHQVTRFFKNIGFGLRTRWKARRRRWPQQRPGIDPVTYLPPSEAERYWGGVTCGEAACARPVPSRNHADDHIATFGHHSNAQADLFRTVAKLQRQRAKR